MRNQPLLATLGLLACVGATTVATPARADTTLYCPFTGQAPQNCLFTWQIKSDFDTISSDAQALSSVFSTLSSIYSGFNAVLNVAGFLGIVDLGPTLDQKVDEILNQVNAIHQDTQNIIASLGVVHADEVADYDNTLLNFVIDQEGKTDGALDTIHQANAAGRSIDPATASQLTQATAESVFDLQSGTVWHDAPTAAYPSGEFDWRFAMAPYLYALGARISVLSALNSPQSLSSQWHDELHDDAAFIVDRVADTKQWTSTRCAEAPGFDGNQGIGTWTDYECSYDQDECIEYDVNNNCIQWYWDPICSYYDVTVTKKCDYFQSSTTVGWNNQAPFQSPYSAGDATEVASLHALGIDSWLQTAASTHALANGVAYAGCHSDSSTRALPYLLSNDANTTIESCVQSAKSLGFNYAGLQDGQECWVGFSMGQTQLPDLSCGMPCAHDSGEMCGGAWANSVYDLQPHPDASAASAAGVRYAGCYQADGPNNLVIASGATVASCVTAARAWGFSYAALGNGGACYGGGAAGTRTFDVYCSTKCTADSAETCGNGAAWRDVLDLNPGACPQGRNSTGGCN
jgi:hypothetical protein